MAFYSKAKRAKKKEINKKKFVCFALVFVVVATSISVYIGSKYWKKPEEEVIQTNEETEEQQDSETVEEQEQEQKEIVDVSNIPEKMGNYDVLGQLVIDKIGVNKNILAISEPASLKLSVAKLCGPNLGESGNFCIDGHNWNNMLGRLSEMQVGDTLYIIDRNTKEKINYEVYDTYICTPTELSCLYDNGKKEITLITCTPGGTKRFICKAYESSNT